MNREIQPLLRAALECTVYLSPCEIGLSHAELLEVGRRVGYLDGEIQDTIRQMGSGHWGRKYVTPNETQTRMWLAFMPEEPEYIDYDALDFVFEEIKQLARSVGEANASLPRDVVAERGAAKGIPLIAMQAAITWLVLAGLVGEKDGVIRFARQAASTRPMPSETRRNIGRPRPRPDRARAYPIVKDLIERRGDGRLSHAEPLDAFAEKIEALGYRPFRLWWMQSVAELRLCDPSSQPVSAAVLAAALVEGALTFVVRHARECGQFQSSDYGKDPRTWKIEDLVRSAASGGTEAILSAHVKVRADTLIRTRQRIHAGRMLSEHPGGPPDLRPDEARDAKGTAEQVVRSILDWLEKLPPGFARSEPISGANGARPG